MLESRIDCCRCEGKFRLCFASDYFDPQVEPPGSGLFALWHSAYDGTISYTVTTPAAAEASVTVDIDYCNSVYNDCNRWGASTADCTMSYTANSDILGCWCQSSVISLASRWQIDASSSCYLESVVTSNLWSYSYCRNDPSAEPRPTTTTSTATFTSSTTAAASVQGGSITTGVALPSTLLPVPALLTSTSSVPSLSARLVKPNLGHVVAALFSLGFVYSMA